MTQPIQALIAHRGFSQPEAFGGKKIQQTGIQETEPCTHSKTKQEVFEALPFILRP